MHVYFAIFAQGRLCLCAVAPVFLIFQSYEALVLPWSIGSCLNQAW